MATVFRTEASEGSRKITRVRYVNCGYLVSYAKYLVEFLNGKRTQSDLDRKVEFRYTEKDYSPDEFQEALLKASTNRGLNPDKL
jgi:hypothetical protein